MKKLAVIILNWNGLELLKEFLPTAVKYTVSEESDLYVADNGSSDESVSWIRENFPEVKILQFSENYGFAEGYNRAIKETGYPYSLLLNSDVMVTDGWWRPLLEFMERNEKAGAAQPKIRSYTKPGMFEYAGAAGGLIDKLGFPYCRGRVFDNLEPDKGQYDDAPVEIAWASGAAMIVRTDLYLQLGGLDADFFAHMEEIDLCLRIYGAGYKVYAVPDSYILHVGGASLPKSNPKKTYLNFRNNLLMLHKNLPEAKGRRIIFIRRLVDTLAWIKFILTGHFGDANAILKAHFDFRKMRKRYPNLPDTDYYSILPGTDRYILLDHYLKTSKKYERL